MVMSTLPLAALIHQTLHFDLFLLEVDQQADLVATCFQIGQGLHVVFWIELAFGFDLHYAVADHEVHSLIIAKAQTLAP